MHLLALIGQVRDLSPGTEPSIGRGRRGCSVTTGAVQSRGAGLGRLKIERYKVRASPMNPWIISISVAYLLGSIPFGYLLVRVFRKQDIREQGSGNIGATNVARSGAKGLGVATLLLDLGKAYLAVMLALHIAAGAGSSARYDIAVAAAVAAVVGHVFPVWLGFRGGKGVASALGVFLALTWPSGVGILLVFLVVFWLTRYVSLASIAGAASFPLFGFYFVPQRTPMVFFGFLFIPLLVIVKHHENIRRLLGGTESRFGSGSKSGAGKAQA